MQFIYFFQKLQWYTNTIERNQSRFQERLKRGNS